MQSVKTNMEKVFVEVDSLRHARNRYEIIFEPLRYIYSDPPWIAKQLAFTVHDQKDKLDALICKINNGFENGQIKKRHIKDIEEYTEELGEMISTDPRLGDLLGLDFLNRIIHLLKREKNPKLQVHAAIILRPTVAFSRNKDEVGVVIQSITPVVLNLICSPVTWVRVKALWLLRNLVFKSSISSVEEALAPVTSIILEDSIGIGVLRPASEILSVVCGAHPKLSREKLKLVLPALMKLIESDVLVLVTSGCRGLAHLCDGREEMIVEDRDLKRLIRRFVYLMNYADHPAIISGLLSLGSIARWGSDDVIEAIIEDEDSLRILSILLEEGNMYMVKQICWIISNITARKEKHIKAVIDGVIDCELIDPLVNVVRNCKLADVRKEALWAISNAMCGVGIDEIECLRISCSKLFWDELLVSFQSDKLFVLVVLEGLVNIKAAQVTCDGQQIDGVELHSIFKNILHDSDLFTKYGSLSCDDNVQKSAVRVVYNLKFTFEGRDAELLICYDDNSMEHLTIVHRLQTFTIC